MGPVIQHELAAFQRQLAGEATTGPWIRRNPVAALAGRRTGSAGPETAQRLRAVVLGPRGGGTTRRRASDAFRLAFAVVIVAVSVPVMRANSAAELSIVHALNPPPEAIRWACHQRVLARLRWGHRLSGCPGPLGAAAGGGPADRRGRRRDLGRVRAARSGSRARRRPACHRRAGRGGHQLSGHAAGGHHRRGSNGAAVPEPSPASPGVVSHHGGRRSPGCGAANTYDCRAT